MLVTRARAGDLEAYDLLVARHTASAYRTAVLLGAGSDSEDVVQESFVKAHHGLARYRGESSFRAWLLAIVANETRNLHRTRSRRDGLVLRAAAAHPGSEITGMTPSTRCWPGSAAPRLCGRYANCRAGTAR